VAPTLLSVVRGVAEALVRVAQAILSASASQFRLLAGDDFESNGLLAGLTLLLT